MIVLIRKIVVISLSFLLSYIIIQYENQFYKYLKFLLSFYTTLHHIPRLDQNRLLLHKNWAWENLPKNKKDEYFPPRNDGAEVWKTKIDYTGTFKGLPYAVGEFHYCNWPILFNKHGTQIVFKEVQYAHLYEQTWMSQTMMHMRDGKLKVGSLLATAINHNRVYHYDGTTRRENIHYSN
jgi:hypothetical protein